MIFRLNLFLWLHLISRKFHFQFQSNPDDKYQPAPFHRKWKIPVSILFFCFGDYGELGNGMFCQNANDFWWVKKKVKLWYFSGEDLEGKVCPLGVSLGNVESFTKWISNWPCSTLCYSSACKFWLFTQSLDLKGARQILLYVWCPYICKTHFDISLGKNTAFSLSIFSQVAYITGETLVKIQTQTFFYCLWHKAGVHFSFDVLPSWADQGSRAHKCIC